MPASRPTRRRSRRTTRNTRSTSTPARSTPSTTTSARRVTTRPRPISPGAARSRFSRRTWGRRRTRRDRRRVGRSGMADWHFDELRHALGRHGWRVTAELPGNDRHISGTWELRRAGDARVLFIDFDGVDVLRTLPMKESYACRARDTAHSLYFRRRGVSGSRPRALWRQERSAFVEALDERAESWRRTVRPPG